MTIYLIKNFDLWESITFFFTKYVNKLKLSSESFLFSLKLSNNEVNDYYIFVNRYNFNFNDLKSRKLLNHFLTLLPKPENNNS